MSDRFAPMPEPPYYAVIFSSQRTEGDNGYGEMAQRMVALAEQQEGCIGVETTADRSGFGITVGYFRDEAAVLAWKNNEKHLAAQKRGKEVWYEKYKLRVAKVERGYAGPEGR